MLGLVLHTALSIGVFPMLYVVSFRALRMPTSAASGAALGCLHMLISMAAMYAVGKLNPRAERRGKPETVEKSKRVLAPGAFGQRYGPLAPPAVAVWHLVYGEIIGWRLRKQPRGA